MMIMVTMRVSVMVVAMSVMVVTVSMVMVTMGMAVSGDRLGGKQQYCGRGNRQSQQVCTTHFTYCNNNKKEICTYISFTSFKGIYAYN